MVWSMVYLVVSSVGTFSCIMGALRNPSASIPHDSLHVYRSSLYCHIPSDLCTLCLSCYYFYIVLSLCLYCCYVMYPDHLFTVVYIQNCVLCVCLVITSTLFYLYTCIVAMSCIQIITLL